MLDQSLLDLLAEAPLVGKGLAGLHVLDKFHATERALAADLAQNPQCADFLPEPLADVLTHRCPLGNQILLLDHLDDRQTRGRGNRVAPEGVPVGEADVLALLAPEGGIVQFVPDDHGGQGRIPAGESLADAQNIGGDPEGLRGKPVSGPAHARDDLVIDQQHAVSGTDLPNPLKVFPVEARQCLRCC